MCDNFRKLATIRQIDKIEPIEGADKIVKATIGGWQVVTAKDNGFKEGDLVAYFEIDSWIPDSLAPFLSKGAITRQYNGVPGARLRTVKLRGQISQGLIMSLDIAPNLVGQPEGTDITGWLGIQKWEPAIAPNMQGKIKGSFPSFLQKTDQERCQNLKKELIQARDNQDKFEVTVKADGSSMTVYYRRRVKPEDYSEGDQIIDAFGVCSKNLSLKLGEENSENTFVKTATKLNLFAALGTLGKNIALQGELIGPGIQGNREGLTDHKFVIFDVFDIDNFRYMTAAERYLICEKLQTRGGGIETVEFESDDVFVIPKILGDDDIIPWLLKMAEGKNKVGVEREGLVFKRLDGQFSFKVISNLYLMNEKD